MLLIGIDVVEVRRWRRLLARRGERAVARMFARVFAPEELEGLQELADTAGVWPAEGSARSTEVEVPGGCLPAEPRGGTPRAELPARTLRTQRLAARLAGRWAAKEAVMKALGVKAGPWRDLVVTTGTGGAPEVLLRGGWHDAARGRNIGGWQVSISHERGLAVAVAVAWRREFS